MGKVTIHIEDYYTASQAAERLSKNSGKPVSSLYVRQLARYGKVTPLKIDSRLSLYPRHQIDTYVVERPGTKAGRASHARGGRRKSTLRSTLA